LLVNSGINYNKGNEIELELRNFELELRNFELELRNLELELKNVELELEILNRNYFLQKIKPIN